MTLTKRQFKICEAVHLKMDYYYMGQKDRRKLTDDDRKEAALLLLDLPNRWWEEDQEWMVLAQNVERRKFK